MINTYDVLETIRMIQDDCLDIRTITMGISLLDCIDSDINVACENVYKKITAKAARLVEVGEQIEKELGIPIIIREFPLPLSLSCLLPASVHLFHLHTLWTEPQRTLA